MELPQRWESSQQNEVQMEVFLERLRPKLCRILSQFRVPPSDSDDLVQQALLALVYGWDSIREPEAWLVGTLRNKCLLYWRQRRRCLYEAVDTVLLEWIADADRPDQDRIEVAYDLDVLLAKLPERSRRLLELRYREGYTPAEIAEKLGYSPKSISKITQRSLALLSRELLRSACSPGSLHQQMETSP